MSHSLSVRFLAAALVPLFGALLAIGCNGEDLGETHQPLTAVCVDPGTEPPPGAWICGQSNTVECDTHQGAFVDFIHVPLGPGATCGSETLTVSQPGPFLPGTYTITVDASVNNGPPAPFCSSTLVVTDTLPPDVTPHVVELWPPNHKMVHVTAADCVTVTDACDGAPKVWLTGASSDEPDNDLGDGMTVGDIQNLGCDGVDLRAERQGTADGRVYTLGWHAEDHAGHKLDGTCQVVVPHDQGGGGAVDSGVDHHVDVPAAACH